MSRRNMWIRLGLIASLCSFPAASFAQSAAAASSTVASTANSIVPKVVNYSGALTDINGKPLTGIVGVTFSLYNNSQGGAPLWLETQNVQPGKDGHYSVTLGSTTSNGLPADVFTSGEARWLGVQPQGQEEQPRVLLVAVPYALKAGDAETIGGLPPSAFMLARPVASSSATAAGQMSKTNAVPPPGTVTGTGTADYVPLWTSSSALVNSVMFQTGSGTAAKIGINTITPAATLDVNGGATIRGLLNLPAAASATAAAGSDSRPFGLVASTFNSHSATATNQLFRWMAEPVNNNTASPSATLNLLFATAPAAAAETGFKFNNLGQITFAPGQTFPGTVTGVGLSAPASDFVVTGSPVTGSGTLGLTWNVFPTSADTANAIVKRDGSGNFSAGAITASSISTGSLGVDGNVNVSGSGNGITFPDGTNQRTAAVFASAVTSELVSTGAGVTNLIQLNITVPTSGFISATSSGYCNASTGSSNVQWAYVIGTSATESWSFPAPLVFLPSGNTFGQIPISGERVLAVSAGSNSIFLNVDNVEGAALNSCGARLTAIFTPAQL